MLMVKLRRIEFSVDEACQLWKWVGRMKCAIDLDELSNEIQKSHELVQHATLIHFLKGQIVMMRENANLMCGGDVFFKRQGQSALKTGSGRAPSSINSQHVFARLDFSLFLPPSFKIRTASGLGFEASSPCTTFNPLLLPPGPFFYPSTISNLSKQKPSLNTYFDPITESCWRWLASSLLPALSDFFQSLIQSLRYLR